jgi:hypothetical protein
LVPSKTETCGPAPGPAPQMMSGRLSPLTSPTPNPCVKLPYLLFGEIGWNAHGFAGSFQSSCA